MTVTKIDINFNCTIQELKPQAKKKQRTACSFQLHHTGIKTLRKAYVERLLFIFQLHHTGIKMYPLYYFQKLTTSFGVIWLVF